MIPGAVPQPAAGGQTGGAPQFASLYVGDLDAEVTEAMLYEIFNTVGPVASIRVCRDSVTRRSLGYAYVNFHSAADAERVMDTLNYSTIKGRCCRIMWSHRDPNLRKTGNGNVFVKNLDKNVDNKALYDTFSLFGNILSCKVATDAEGRSRGYGFVHYETAEAAKQAIEKVNNMQIGEKTVYVGEFIPRDGRAPAEVTHFTNIYVKNFPEDWDEEKVLEEFSVFGPITSSMVQKDKKNRQFAFLNFEDSEHAKAAIEALDGKDYRTEDQKAEQATAEEQGEEPLDLDDIEGQMFVSRAMTKAEREAMLKAKFKTNTSAPVGVNLYIKNLPDDCNDVELRTMFSQFGEITSARVMCDAKNRSKGFGFVCYKTPDEATKAVTEMHLKTVKGKPLYVGLAEKKEERSTRLAARYKGDKGGAKSGLVTFGGGGKDSMMMKGGLAQPGLYQQYPQGMGAMGKGMMQPQMMNQQLMAQQGMMRPFNVAAQRPAVMGYPQGVNPMMGGKFPGGGMNFGGKGGAPGAGMGGMGVAAKGAPLPGGAQGGGPGGQGGPGAGGARPQVPREQQLTAQMLAQAPPGMQKQMLGEKLYPAVSRLQPDLAGKITGMMLEMDNAELLLMLDSEAQLRQKVEEAMRVLQQMPK